jgi:hypothetical protein
MGPLPTRDFSIRTLSPWIPLATLPRSSLARAEIQGWSTCNSWKSIRLRDEATIFPGRTELGSHSYCMFCFPYRNIVVGWPCINFPLAFSLSRTRKEIRFVSIALTFVFVLFSDTRSIAQFYAIYNLYFEPTERKIWVAEHSSTSGGFVRVISMSENYHVATSSPTGMTGET